MGIFEELQNQGFPVEPPTEADRAGFQELTKELLRTKTDFMSADENREFVNSEECGCGAKKTIAGYVNEQDKITKEMAIWRKFHPCSFRSYDPYERQYKISQEEAPQRQQSGDGDGEGEGISASEAQLLDDMHRDATTRDE